MGTESKLSRRSFIKRSATATGGVISIGVLGTARRTMTQEADEPREFESFTEHQGLTVEAMAEAIFPADNMGPGATDARVINYIDKSLSAHHEEEHEIYEIGLAYLDAFCDTRLGFDYVELPPDVQSQVLSAMDQAENPEGWPADAEISSRDFLRTVIGHTMEGMFSDPKYGGNYNEIGWKLIGFPGPKPFGYDPPFGWYDMIIPEIEYPAFKPYTGKGK